MRRLFTILLLALLPLQFSWAAVGVYCWHETGEAARHFGHHDHQHKGNSCHGDKAPEASGGIDIDNDVCHSVTAAVIQTDYALALPVRTSALVFDYRFSPNSSPHYPPERPNWVPLA